MSHQLSSAVSVVSIVGIVAVVIIGYRLGRTHAAWREVRFAKQAVRGNRRIAWRHTLTAAVGTAALLATIAVAGYDLAR